MRKNRRLFKIVSGGQTGADRGGLDAAIELNIPHGGWCPKGRGAEDGKIPAKYNLTETTSFVYWKRTEQNVIDSSATIIFTFGSPTGGSKLTLEFAVKHSKPHIHIDLNYDDTQIINKLSKWLADLHNPQIILNIAGTRESEAPGIQERVYGIVVRVCGRLRGHG